MSDQSSLESIQRQHRNRNIIALYLTYDVTVSFSFSNHWRSIERQRRSGSSWSMPNSGGESSLRSDYRTNLKWSRSLRRFTEIPTSLCNVPLMLWFCVWSHHIPISLAMNLNWYYCGYLCIMQDENGVNRPVCSCVRVLRAGRLLESPRQAARFVSLLAHEKAPVVGGGAGKQEQWCTLMAFLCRGKVRRTGFRTTQLPV